MLIVAVSLPSSHVGGLCVNASLFFDTHLGGGINVLGVVASYCDMCLFVMVAFCEHVD